MSGREPGQLERWVPDLAAEVVEADRPPVDVEPAPLGGEKVRDRLLDKAGIAKA